MSKLLDLRRHFHAQLIESGVLSLKNGVVSNADRASNPSKRLAAAIFEQLCESSRDELDKLAGQTAGAGFETICASFLEAAFLSLTHIRPGDWIVGKDGIQNGSGLAVFEQFSHLAEIEAAAKSDPRLRAVLGSDYLIKPDVLVARKPLKDDDINAGGNVIVDDQVAQRTPLRAVNSQAFILHATISCKWTMRSDRAQNARTEALNLMKNRKGRVPHISVITAEPTPGRIASLAYGTGEIDCVYHFALSELVESLESDPSNDGTLSAMIEGNRLRDISDLPLDIAT